MAGLDEQHTDPSTPLSLENKSPGFGDRPRNRNNNAEFNHNTNNTLDSGASNVSGVDEKKSFEAVGMADGDILDRLSRKDVAANFDGGEEKSSRQQGLNSPPPAINPMDPSQYPDGGLQAWLCVLGGFFGLFVSFGWINAVGVFQEYYHTHQLRDYTEQEIAWIPALEGSMMWANGVWIGRVYDNYGPRYILLIGTFLHVFGLMMASISKKYYQFILSQGICSPLGASMIFYCCTSTTATWFFRRRALALGLIISGSSVGGVIFPIMVQRLVAQIGFAWTMRTCAFLMLAIMAVANTTVRSRIPPAPKAVRLKDFTSPWKETPFTLLAVGTFVNLLGLFTPFTFLVSEARGRGVDEALSFYLIAILNGSSTFGRTVPNYMADKLGRFTVFLVVAALNVILIFALWLPTSGTGPIVTFAVLFGFSSGANFSLLPPLIAHISPIQQIGLRTGLVFGVGSVAILVGSPIGGQLIVHDNGGFRGMQAFSGALCAGGFVVYLVLWIKLGGLKKTKV